MTIAAGFVHENGVLLCSDSQIETWNHKSYEPKIERFDYPNGSVCFALSGIVRFAHAAIQKCRRKAAQARTREELLEVLENTLDSEYRRNVFSNPDASNRMYQFIIGISDKDAGTSLYSTFETSLTSVDRYECIGIGEALAKHLLSSLYNISNREKDVLRLAAYMLSVVKKRVPGCGGGSNYLSLRKDGTSKSLDWDMGAVFIEHHAGFYDLISRVLFLSIVKPSVEFEQQWNSFGEEAIKLRGEWSEMVRKNAEARRVAKEGPESPRHDSSPPPSSPESPGESDES